MRKTYGFVLILILILSFCSAPGVLAGPAGQIDPITPEASGTSAPTQSPPSATSPVESPTNALLQQTAEPTATHTAEQTATDAQPTATASQPVESPSVPPTAQTPAASLAPPPGEETTSTPEVEITPAAELKVTGVEPAKISGLAGGQISVYGQGFVPGTAVRLVGFGILDSSVVNSTAIRAVVPPGLKKGSYDLDIIRPDGDSAYVEGAFRVIPPKDPTPTATASGRYSVFAQPQVVIQSASTEPELLRPGSPFTLSFQVVNQGDYTAANVRISLGASDLAIPRQGSSLLVVDQIGREEAVDLDLPLALTSAAPSGYQSLELVVEYVDYLGQVYSSSQSVGLNVSSNLAAQPLVILSTYQTDPEALSPGDTFTLDLALTNVGKDDAGQVTVTLGGADGGGINPFAILGSSNVKFLSELAGGDTTHIEHRLILDGAAESGVYNLPVSLAYDAPSGERRMESHLVNLLVNRRPQIEVDYYSAPDTGLAGEPLNLPIELVNIGRSAVNISTAEISTQAGIEITTGSAYIGALDGGTAGTLDAVIIPKQGGTLEIQVEVNYLDDFNQPQVFTRTLTVQVEEPEAPAPGEAEAQEQQAEGLLERILRILRGLLGLGS